MELRAWRRATLLVVAMNGLFLLPGLFATAVPQGTVERRVRRAFATGELGDRDYLPYDARRGWHQYNDCNILQMLSNPDDSLAGRAWGPWLHLADADDAQACATLRRLVVDGGDLHGLVSSRYARYWHGYMPPVAVLLVVLDVAQVRELFRVAVFAAVLSLALAGYRRKAFMPLTASVALGGLLFWGVPYYGLGFSHAPGDAVAMLGIGALVYWHRSLAATSRLVPYCAAYGALIVYFEMLTGPLPVVAGLLFPTVYLVFRVEAPQRHGARALLQATKGLVAFVVGAALTVLARVALAALAVRPSGLDTFFGNLALYVGSVDEHAWIPSALEPLGRLVRKGVVLTYGSVPLLATLYLSALLAALVAFGRARARAGREAWTDLAAFGIGVAAVPLWTLLLQEHTYAHAAFMARILIVPVSLCWAAAAWQRRSGRSGE
jgi:hypothetical protein